ncbi:hypothetical protein [Nocardioides massiliensis]|nr:hypothetical protein [Nocardioides massiliensis]
MTTPAMTATARSGRMRLPTRSDAQPGVECIGQREQRHDHTCHDGDGA